MQIFSYKAVNANGLTVQGTMEAKEEKVVINKLQEMGYIPIKVSLPVQSKGFSLEISKEILLSFFKKISLKDVMTFTQELSTLVDAGLPLDRGLSILTELTENPRLKRIAEKVLRDVEGGSSLADALSRHPKAFSKLYVNMIRAGEAGGVLEIVLMRLSSYLESAQELREYVRSAMVYPILLSLVGGTSIIILLTWVVPRFALIFSEMNQTLPLPTLFLLTLSNTIKRFWWLILSILVTLYISFKRYVKGGKGRMRWDSLKLRLFLIGKLIQKIEVARFSRTLGTLLKSGVPILQAINIVKETIVNSIIASSMEKIHEGVKKGEGMSMPLKESGVFHPLAIHMIKVGEETGRLDEMLLKVADNFDREIRTAVKSLVSLLEPMMILIMGLVVGFVVLSMLMAIFSVNELPF